MLKRLGPALLLAVVFILVCINGSLAPYQYFILFTVLVISTLYGLSEHDRYVIAVACCSYVVMTTTQWYRIGFSQIVLGNLVAAIALLLWSYFLHDWKRRIVSVDLQKGKVLSDIAVLRDKYHARLESLDHLEKQVGGLLDLFEAAKDFNECLYFEQLMRVLDRKVKEQIPFHALTLSLWTGHNNKEEEVISKSMSIGKSDQENLVVRLSPSFFEALCSLEIKAQNKVVRFESLNDMDQSELTMFPIAFPLWIFPLEVEKKTVAALTIEGALADDFPKYELLASQLALQVKRISLYETVKELSIIDGLTKTYVRRHFLERFEEELKRSLKRGTALSVLMLDIDHFKSYNDQFGHLVGNSTLREVATVIREHVRKVDLVARYGGEEFAIVMPDIGYPANVESAERIRSSVAKKRFRLYDEETQATVSIGVSAFPKDLGVQKTSEFNESLVLDLIQKADKALYCAKEEGRNRVVSYEQMSHMKE